MRRSITLAILCAAFLLRAFAQSSPVNTVAGMGYLYPPTTVAPGQLITVFLQGNPQGDISATVSGFPAPVLEVRPVRRTVPDQLHRAAAARELAALLQYGSIQPDGERGRVGLV
jgi:hypothetical protein